LAPFKLVGKKIAARVHRGDEALGNNENIINNTLDNMKRITKIGLAVAAAGLLSAVNTFALQVYVDRVPGYFSGNGGEFWISPTDQNLLNTVSDHYLYPDTIFYHVPAPLTTQRLLGFESFCVEHGEGINLPGLYNAVINDRAIEGGVGPQGDVISKGTAWLYAKFAMGQLAGYNYTPGAGREASAATLQEAFWWLENDLTLVNPGNNAFLALAQGHFGGTYASLQDDNDFALINVKVLNLTRTDGTLRQDQLIYLPDGGLTVTLLGSALMMLSFVGRRFRK
jgi:hypothetical protein